MELSTPTHLVSDGFIIDEVSKGDGGCPRVILVVDTGAGGFLLLPPGDSQLVPGDKDRDGTLGQGRAKGCSLEPADYQVAPME